MLNKFDVVFWGVMGSCPGASPAASKSLGMNTPCVQIDTGNEILILDSGTGIVGLGRQLDTYDKPLDIHLFITHSHWDHIQGFPFFGPAYDKRHTITIYGQFRDTHKIDTIFKDLMKPPYFPAPFSALKADIRFRELSPVESVELPSGVRILNIPSDHPGGNLIYRIEKDGRSVCYVTDLAHGRNINDPLLTFVRDTDLLIYDANFTNFEFISPQYEGWGHSTWEKAVHLAVNAKVRKLMLFHHALHRTHQELMDILEEARKLFPATWLATEVQRIHL